VITATHPDAGAPTGRLHLSARLQQLRSDSLVRNSILLVTTNVINAGVGYLYWMVAARLFEDEVVGRATAVIAAMNLTALVSNLGLGTSLVQHLSSRRTEESWTRYVSAVFLLGFGTALTAGTAVALMLPRVIGAFGPVMNWPTRIIFVVGAVSWVLSGLVDKMFVAERRADGMLARNSMFAVGKLLLIIPVGLSSFGNERWLVGSWVVGSILSVSAAIVFVVPRIGRQIRIRTAGTGTEVKSIFVSTLGHHLANLGGEFPMYLLPVIVISRAGDAASAYFYVTWMVGSIFFTVSSAASSSLFAEGSHSPEQSAHQFRRALVLIGMILTPVALAMVVMGRSILGLFGSQYSDAGYSLLLLLVVSAVPDALTNVWVARWRVLGWISQTAIANVGMAAIALAFTWWQVPNMGIAAAGWGWIISQSLGTIYTLMVEAWHWWKGGRVIASAAPLPARTDRMEQIV